jgi:hypothetical protein
MVRLTLLLGIVRASSSAIHGRLWVCGACARPRNITNDDLVEGAQLIGAATALEALVSGAQTLSL